MLLDVSLDTQKIKAILRMCLFIEFTHFRGRFQYHLLSREERFNFNS